MKKEKPLVKQIKGHKIHYKQADKTCEAYYYNTRIDVFKNGHIKIGFFPIDEKYIKKLSKFIVKLLTQKLKWT